MKEKAQNWSSGWNHDTFGGWAPHWLARWHRDHSSSVYRGYEHISICFDLFMAFVGPAGPCSLVRLPWNSITSTCFMDHTGFLPLCAYPVSADTAGGLSNAHHSQFVLILQTYLRIGTWGLGIKVWGYPGAVWTSTRVSRQFRDTICVFCTGWHRLGLWRLLQASSTRMCWASGEARIGLKHCPSLEARSWELEAVVIIKADQSLLTLCQVLLWPSPLPRSFHLTPPPPANPPANPLPQGSRGCCLHFRELKELWLCSSEAPWLRLAMGMWQSWDWNRDPRPQAGILNPSATLQGSPWGCGHLGELV